MYLRKDGGSSSTRSAMLETDDESDSEETSSYRLPTAQEEEEDGDGRKERERRTGQLLFLGSSLAIVGLLLSLVMLLFNADCSSDYLLGAYVNRTGEFEICREMYHPTEVQAGFTGRVQIMVVDVPYMACTEDADCAGVNEGFCAGGSSGLRMPDFCKSNGCVCKSVLPDCGLKNYIKWYYQASDLVPNCKTASCLKNRSLVVPLWMFADAPGGCQFRRKTGLIDVQLWVQHDLEVDGILDTIVPEDPAYVAGPRMWSGLQNVLAKTPDVRFNSFWPSTISESVSDGFSPEGRIFFGFMLCASLCLLASDYTSTCITVDLPNLKIPLLGLQFNTLRTWLPPIGLILLSTVQMVPTSKILNLPGALMTIVHLIGAQFCFLVYLVCEAAALFDTLNTSEMFNGRECYKKEWHIRMAFLVLGGCSMATFGGAYVLLFLFSGSEETPYLKVPYGGFSDVYKLSFSLKKVMFLRPAEGPWQTLKVISYTAEFLVAFAILVSHLVIWGFFEAHRRKRVTSSRTLKRVEPNSDEDGAEGDREVEEGE